jgi:hypothetical protein
MVPTGAFGDQLGRYFGLERAPSLATPTPQRPQFAVTRIVCNINQLGLKQEIPPEDTFVVTLYLMHLQHIEVWQRGRPISARECSPGSISIVNLLDELTVYIGGPLDCLSFYIPRTALDMMTEDMGPPALKQLHCTPGLVDPTLEQIGAAMLPLIDAPECVAPDFLEHIARATSIHLAHTYGDFHPQSGFGRRSPNVLSARAFREISSRSTPH